MILKDDILVNIQGGAISLKSAVLMGIIGLITLLIGVMDGYVNPTKCNSRK